MTNKKTLLLAQALIALMMATFMTGFFSFLSLGPTSQWILAWGKSFVIAFPVAFLASLVISPIAFRMAHAITRP
jgi:hypothetical protein